MLVPKVYAPECVERLSKERTFLGADGSECLVARPLAASKGLSTHLTVLHVHLRGMCSHSSAHNRHASAHPWRAALAIAGSNSVCLENILPVVAHTSEQLRHIVMQRLI